MGNENGWDGGRERASEGNGSLGWLDNRHVVFQKGWLSFDCLVINSFERVGREMNVNPDRAEMQMCLDVASETRE